MTDIDPTPLTDAALAATSAAAWSSLGRPAVRFERDDPDVRKEYAWVPGLRDQEARARVLRSFLDRLRLYHGEHAVALLEAQARINLAAALTFTYRRLAQ